VTKLRASFRKPFAQQVAAFRLRLGNLRPTARWDDVWQSGHDTSFMVAGAVKADLLADLAAAIDKAEVSGTTLDEFRRDFRQIVETRGWHGWTGEGTKKGEAWRTKVIYKTNLSTSYAAGRMAQLVEGNFKYWVYRHGGSLEPRLQHLGWNGLILPPDHPFWATHAPPNGWGCSCYIVGARSLAGAKRVGGKPGLTLPPDWEALNPKTGAPEGIDKGWAYAPGASVARTVAAMTDKLAGWPYEVAKAFMQSQAVERAAALSTRFRALDTTQAAVTRYADAAFKGEATPAFQTLGLLTPQQAGQAAKVLDGIDLGGFDFALQALRLPDFLQSVSVPGGTLPFGVEDFAGIVPLLDQAADWKTAGFASSRRPLIQMTIRHRGFRNLLTFEVDLVRRTLVLVSATVRVSK
jgi:hypothetical protein